MFCTPSSLSKIPRDKKLYITFSWEIRERNCIFYSNFAHFSSSRSHFSYMEMKFSKLYVIMHLNRTLRNVMFAPLFFRAFVQILATTDRRTGRVPFITFPVSWRPWNVSVYKRRRNNTASRILGNLKRKKRYLQASTKQVNYNVRQVYKFVDQTKTLVNKSMHLKKEAKQERRTYCLDNITITMSMSSS